MPQSQFLIEAFDRERWCPVLQAMFPVDDPEALRAILAGMADDDPELEKTYFWMMKSLQPSLRHSMSGFDASAIGLQRSRDQPVPMAVYPIGRHTCHT